MNSAEILTLKYLRQLVDTGYPDFVLKSLPTETVYTPDVVQRTEVSPQPPSKDLPKQQVTSSVVDSSYENKRNRLRQLYYEVQNCQGCSLSNQRKKIVFGSGNASASLMIIGGAPGREDEEVGLPFSGAVGEQLDKMLQAIKIDKSKDAFLTNAMKCRMIANRQPDGVTCSPCLPILLRQIEIIQPKALLLLGETAVNVVLELQETLEFSRQRVHSFRGIPAIASYHPALYLVKPEFKRPGWEDLQRLQQLLREMGLYGS